MALTLKYIESNVVSLGEQDRLFLGFSEKVIETLVTKEEQGFAAKLSKTGHINGPRSQQFLLGRVAAHLAVNYLEDDKTSILNNHQGIPIFPDELVGSIAHTSEPQPIAVSVVTKRDSFLSVGIDIESAMRPLSSALIQRYFPSFMLNPALSEALKSENLPEIFLYVALEAAYKAFFVFFSEEREIHFSQIKLDYVSGNWLATAFNQEAIIYNISLKPNLVIGIALIEPVSI